MGRIGIFGGTFNPIHVGHVLAVEEFYRQLHLDQVILIPAAIPPHKELPQGSPDAQTRLEMVKTAVAHLPYVTVSDIELNRAGKSYTADTLRQLQNDHDELFLMMGSDIYLTLADWYEPETVLSLATIVLAHRSEESDKKKAQLAEYTKRLHTMGARIVQLENVFTDISSTTVRRMLIFRCAESYLAPAVLRIIEDKQLYGIGENLKNLPFEQLREKSLALHKPKRVPHVIGCSETAEKLALQYDADPVDAARAGILHDITKALDGEQQLQLCKKYGIMLSELEYANDKLLHSKTGAAIAEHIFGENAAVCDAIFWHTTGKADMTTLEKIIYLADYMEPNRDFDGVQTLRDLAETSLDAAILQGFEMSLVMLAERGKIIDPNSLAARDFLLPIIAAKG